MFFNCFQKETCNRRDFMAATGVIVAGGILSCSRDEQRVERKSRKKHILRLPADPIIVRVRIGKVRDTHGCAVDGEVIFRNETQWEPTRFSGEPANNNEAQVVWIKRGLHTVVVSKKTKVFTGTISLHPRKDISKHALDIVAHIPMESYLPGVIAGELFSHWHPTTFAAQAVAARSYATAQHLLRKTTSHFDLSDGPSSQVFLGDVTLDVAHRAVSQTKGLVMTWDGTVVPSYYSACCGGLAATANDAIGKDAIHDISPLQGGVGEDVCTTLDVHRWKIERSHRNLCRRLAIWTTATTHNKLDGLRSIRSIRPRQTNHHGRPTTLEIMDRHNKSFSIEAKHFVRAANASVPSLPSPTPRLWSSNFSAIKEGSKIEISGVGLGHGVGMCQYGAQILAGRGKSWESILSRYYPAVTFDTVNTKEI
jgi:SpoIID/LytB domain protein